MGFPTPFPEPESPELQRFAVRSPSEVVSRLRSLKEAAVPLTAFVDADRSFGVVTLQGVDETAGKLVFAGTPRDGFHERLPGGPLATFVGYDEWGKVQFAARPAIGRRHMGDRAFSTPIPEKLFALQRRNAARMRMETAREAICRIPVPGSAGEWEALKVLDISIGGIALLTYPQQFELMVDAEINDCRLDMPGVGGAVVSLRVRHVSAQPWDKQGRCCGCELVGISAKLQLDVGGYSGKPASL